MSADTPLILGISDSHDAGIALMQGGRVLAAVNEERFTRIKMADGFPAQSIAALPRLAGIASEAIDLVALAGRSSLGTPPQNNDFTDSDGSAGFSLRAAEGLDRLPGGRRLMASPAANALYRGLMRPLVSRRVAAITGQLRAAGIRAPVRTFDHHDCHVASAYYSQGAPDCLVISNDGFGDMLCAKIAAGRAGRLTTLDRTGFFDSLGVYYNYVTLFCGFPKGHHAGKTTGLAAYGDPDRTLPLFRELIGWDHASGRYRNRGPLFRNCVKDLFARLKDVSHEDAAAGIQRHCEQVITTQVREWMRRTGLRRIALTGGVHANVKVNQRIAEIADVEEMFVFPNMGDGGLPFGAACLAWAAVDPAAAPVPLRDVYLGPSYSDDEITGALRSAGVAFTRPPNLAVTVADALAANRIVARYDGRMEYGPRALGNRSILYPATDPAVNTWLNRQLRRTEFMPFAPVVRQADAPLFFQGLDDRTAHAAAFMTVTYDVTQRCRDEAPAVVHVDGTARPQVLARDVNPGYDDILLEYQRRTGCAMLVNTSFNMHESPIVCTPDDAIAAFFESGLDALAIGPFWVANPSGRSGAAPR